MFTLLQPIQAPGERDESTRNGESMPHGFTAFSSSWALQAWRPPVLCSHCSGTQQADGSTEGPGNHTAAVFGLIQQQRRDGNVHQATAADCRLFSLPLCVAWRGVPHFGVTGMHWQKSWAHSLTHTQMGSRQVPLGSVLPEAASKHFLPPASLSAGCLLAFFLFAPRCFCTGHFPPAAPAFSRCVPPAAQGKSRISRAHCKPPHKERTENQWGTSQADVSGVKQCKAILPPFPRRQRKRAFRQMWTSDQRQPRLAIQFTGREAIFPLSKANHSGVNKTGKHLVSEHLDSASVLNLKTPHSKSAGSRKYKSPTWLSYPKFPCEWL